MRCKPAAASARSRALLALLLPLLAHCGVAASQRRAAQPIPHPIAGSAGTARAARVDLAADPSLQQLLDPYRSEQGPSWLGGDVASSIRLADDRWAWIFGDTLLGSVRDRCSDGRGYCERSVSGPGAGMIANSAGMMVRGADGVLSPVVKYWRTDAAGAPAPIFSAPGDGFLWPLAGVRIGTVLLVAANRHTEASGLLPTGNVLVRVWNPDAPPDAWLYDVHPVRGFRSGQEGSAPLSWTTALVPAGGQVYVFGSRDVGVDARTVLARLDAGDLAADDWQPELEYLLDAGSAAAPVWGRTLDVSQLHVIDGLPGTSEATVDFADGLGWYTFQIPALRYEIHLYTASDLLGPWQDRGVVAEIPTSWRATHGVCPKTERADPEWGATDPECAPRYAAYAPKAHPELAPAGGYVVSYNVNTWSGGLDAAVHALETLHGFYVPQILSTSP